MKKTGACIWIWWCWCMIGIKLVTTLEQPQPQPQPPSIKFDVQEDNYKSVLEKLRNEVASDTNYCSIPTTAHTTKSGSKYIHVVLSVGNKEVTFGIAVKDLYIWYYLDKCDNEIRATFVRDAEDDVKSDLFRDATIKFKRSTNFDCSYTSLGKVIGSEYMWKLELQIDNLRRGIHEVYGKHVDRIDKKKEAKFFFTVIQMVSEAARFKFIEEAIIKNDKREITRAKRQDFEKNWDNISKAFYKAQKEPDTNSRCTEFNPSLKIGNSREFKHVNELKSDIGILKSQESSLDVGVDDA